jgi:probable rRNA maturation factor
MIHLNIDSAYRGLRFDTALKKASEAALLHEDSATCDLSLVITGDQKVKELNKQFRGIDQETDVLSFPSDANPKEKARYLGDVIISLPRAEAQAKSAGHTLGDELQLLAIHGTLHLLGYDHGSRGSKAKMWAVQDQILQSLGINVDVDKAVASHPDSLHA